MQIIFLQNLIMSIFCFYMLVLKPDELLLSVLKQQVSKEFKRRLRVAVTSEQGLHKNH
jgi:hypothetical protein